MNLELLKKYHEDGLLHKQIHPSLDLTIWNYTPKVQYERLWDEITKQCRGLVTNSNGDVVARPFQKFFNYEELSIEEIPNEHFNVYEKMDGSLGILFHYNDNWVFSSRGSFTSDQAIKGFQLLSKYDYKSLDKNNTYLFEIIYPKNRIVVNYGDVEKLVLLGVIETKTGNELNIYNENYDLLGFELVLEYNGIVNFDHLKTEISNSQEGFVIRFKNGMRMKIKGDEYVRLHKIITNISNRDIWEYLKEGKPLDEILEKVPDEFYNWVRDTKDQFESDFLKIRLSVEDEFYSLVNRKEFAEKVKDNKYQHLLFKRLNSYSPQLNDMIWDILYPTYSKPFKKDE